MENATGNKVGSSLSLAVLLLGAILIGATLGAIALNSFLYSEAEREPEIITPPRTGMQILQDYRCMKAESKQIILRGVEDNYAAAGDEDIFFSDLHEFMQNRNGKKGAVTVDRSYDEGGMDRFLLDQIEIPSRSVNGIFVIKARSLTETTNDSINIGDLLTRGEKRNFYGTGISSIPQSETWQLEGGVYSAKFSDLIFKDLLNESGENIPRNHDNLLEFIQSDESENASVGVYIGDDHAVDFIGAAMCLPPANAKGMSLLVSPFPGKEDIAKLSCVTGEQEDHCDPYKGDTLCSMSLPLACFDYTGETAPDHVVQTQRENIWSKGDVKFTPAVRGADFDTQEDVHANYRAATHQENLSGQLGFLARGTAEVTQAWVHAKTEPYGNCWDLITEYETHD